MACFSSRSPSRSRCSPGMAPRSEPLPARPASPIPARPWYSPGDLWAIRIEPSTMGRDRLSRWPPSSGCAICAAWQARACREKGGEDTVVLSVGRTLAITDASSSRAGETRGSSGRWRRRWRTGSRRPEVPPRTVEGLDDARWVLLDYGDFVVHVLLDERDFYQLDHLSVRLGALGLAPARECGRQRVGRPASRAASCPSRQSYLTTQPGDDPVAGNAVASAPAIRAERAAEPTDE